MSIYTPENEVQREYLLDLRERMIAQARGILENNRYVSDSKESITFEEVRDLATKLIEFVTESN